MNSNLPCRIGMKTNLMQLRFRSFDLEKRPETITIMMENAFVGTISGRLSEKKKTEEGENFVTVFF